MQVATNQFQSTPIASIEGQVEIVHLSLDKVDELDIKVNATDMSGRTAFDLAEHRQYKEIVLAFQDRNNRQPCFRINFIVQILILVPNYQFRF